MKYLLGIMMAMGLATAAYASCTSHTYVVNNKVVTCTSCCYGNGNCQINCY